MELVELPDKTFYSVNNASDGLRLSSFFTTEKEAAGWKAEHLRRHPLPKNTIVVCKYDTTYYMEAVRELPS
jgi:hypothetical protein